MARTALVTGTSTGIGLAITERLAADGWTVYAGVRKSEDADRLKRDVTGDVRPVILDVANNDHIASVVSDLEAELGERGLDALVNNAGVPSGGPIEALPESEWRHVFDINVFGLVNLTRETLPMIIRAKGRVSNIASLGGRVSSGMLAPYTASKHAVEAITESLRFETTHLGVKVSCIEPGEVKTPIWDKGAAKTGTAADQLSPEMMERYSRQMDMLVGFMAEGAKHGIKAEKVADAVAHALTSSRPKDRYLVGPDARVAGTVISRMPDRVRRGMLAANQARQAASGAKIRARASE